MKESDGISINGVWIAAKKLPGICAERLESDLPEWEKKVYRFLLDWMDDRDYIVQFSSGTTGKKKEFRLPKPSMRASSKITCKLLGLQRRNSALLCLPVDYIAGKMMIVRSWICGLDLRLTNPGGTPELSKYEKINFSAMVPLQVYNLLNQGEVLNKIQTLIIGGGEIRSELENRLKDYPTRIYATYGMAETCSHVALRKVNGQNSSALFTAIPGVKLDSDDENRLMINADFLPESVQTNDLVEFASPNSFRWLGRFDNLINSGGIKIIPEELEEKIAKILGLECALIGIPDVKLGKKLVLVLEANEGHLSPNMVLEKLKTELNKHFVPKAIFQVKELPRNKSFKINRKKLQYLLRG